MYRIEIDYGKPYEETAQSDEELKELFKKYAKIAKESAYFDIKVFYEIEVTERPDIQEMMLESGAEDG